MFVIELIYKADLERIDAQMKAHMAFLNRCYTSGNFLVSGRKVPREGGIILAVAKSREDIEAIVREDPFVARGLADFRIIEFRVSQRAENIDQRLVELVGVASERAPASAPEALRRVHRSFSGGGSEPRERSAPAKRRARERAGESEGRSPSGKLKPMRVSAGFKAMVLDHLAEIGDVTPRAMFGGVGLYCDGLFFGIIAADVLYLKVDASNRPDFLRAGCAPFQPYADRTAAMQYYNVPLAVVESALDLDAWARKAVAVARRAQSSRSR